MPELERQHLPPIISHTRDHQNSTQGDQSSEDDENWSDVATATRSEESPDHVSRRRPEVRLNSHRPSLRRRLRPRNVEDTWEDTADEGPGYFGRQRSYPGGQTVPYDNPFPPQTHTHSQNTPGSYFPDPRPFHPHPSEPQHPNLYNFHPHPPEAHPPNTHTFHPFPNNPYPTNGYNSCPVPPYPTNILPPQPFMPPYDSDFQPKPPLVPTFHIEYEMEEVKRELNALKLEKIQVEKERKRAERKEKEAERKEMKRRDWEEKLQREVERKVKAEVDKKLQRTREPRDSETQSDPGRRRHGSDPRHYLERSFSLAAQRQRQDYLPIRDERRGGDTDRYLLQEFAQYIEDKVRRRDGRRYYDESVRDSLDEQPSRSRFEVMPRQYSQNRTDEDLRTKVDALIDIVCHMKNEEVASTAADRLLVQNERVHLPPAPQPPQQFASENDPFGKVPSRAQDYQYSNYGGSSGLPSPSSHVAIENGGQYSPSESSRLFTRPQRPPQRAPSSGHDENWDRHPGTSIDASQEQPNRTGAADGYPFPMHARSNEPRDRLRGVGERRADLGGEPNMAHGRTRVNNHQSKRAKRREPTGYAEVGGHTSDESDDQELYTRHPKPYALNRRELSNTILEPLPPAPDPPPRSANNNANIYSAESRDRERDRKERSAQKDQSSSNRPTISIRTGQTAVPQRGEADIVA
ncbi:hypothetical protein EG329_001451 [Mollisiaceae sp. DMI_Dod_QoI]|nr:hypothetical protein EG329_001451 [Helotiales sp. DMI_Dod_QoI]